MSPVEGLTATSAALPSTGASAASAAAWTRRSSVVRSGRARRPGRASSVFPAAPVSRSRITIWRVAAPPSRSWYGTSTDTPARGRILARDGRAIVKPRAVVDVAVEVAKVRDPAETARGLPTIDGTDADAAALAKQIRSVPKRSFVPVITLRQADYERVAASLDAVRGVSLYARTSPLPPTKTFARALLGTVGPVTAEQLEKTPSLGPGDEIGQSGLQAAYQERLGGAATRKVVVRDRETGAAGRTLLERPGRRAGPLRTTLDLRVQAAAEEALAP